MSGESAPIPAHLTDKRLKIRISKLPEKVRERLYDHLYTNGRPSRDGRLRLLGVSKAYDDDLYAYGVGRFPEEFEGLKIKHIETETIEGFERLHYYMQPVPEEVVREALEGDG